MGNNSFVSSSVIFYDDSAPFYTYSLEFNGTTYDRTYTPLDSNQGKGPALFFDCEADCALDISETTEVSDSKILIGF